MRYVVARKGEYEISDNFKKLLLKELEQGLDKFETYLKFKQDCEKSKKKLTQILSSLKNQKKSFWLCSNFKKYNYFKLL